MDKRLRIALIGLALMLIASLAFSFITLMSKTGLIKDLQSLKQAKERLEKESADLASQLTRLLEEKKAASGKLSQIENELEIAAKDRDVLKNKYSLVQKEKESLIEKLQELSSRPSVSVMPEEKKEPSQQVQPQIIMPEGMSDEYWGAVLRESAQLKINNVNLENELASIKSRYNETEAEGERLRQEIVSLSGQKDQLLKKISDNEKVAQELSVNLAKGEREKRDLKVQINNIEKEKLDLQAQINRLEEQISELGKKPSDISAADSTLKEKKAESEIKKTTIELSPIVVRPLSEEKIEEKKVEVVEEAVKEEEEVEIETAPEPRKLSGKILSIDTENNFVIVDIGKDHGVELNRYLDVYRGSKKIGRVQVIKIRDSVSACDIINSTKAFKAGDSVK